MDYKKLIIEMIQKMKNENYLRDIFYFVEVPYEAEMKQEKENGGN